MALNVPSFDYLRETNNRALDRAGKIKQEERRDERMQELLDRREEIENLASGQSQREDYGVEQWHRDFVPLRSITDQKERDLVWAAMPNCRFKRFQESFSHPHQLIVPPYTIHKGGRVDFHGINFDTLSLQGCIVGVDRISGPVAESLKLVDDSETRGNPLERIRLRELGCINALKQTFEEASPVQDRHQRVSVVRETEPTNPDASIAGLVIYTREKFSGQKGIFRPRTVQVFGNGFDALAKTTHERDEYDAELTMLATYEQQLHDLHHRLNTEWSDVSARDQLRTEGKDLLTRASNSLVRCVNEYKSEAQQMLDAAAMFTDKSGKENVTMVLTRLVGVLRRLRGRSSETFGKGSFNQADASALNRRMYVDATTLAQFRDGVLQAPDRFAAFSQLFSDSPLSDRALEASIKGFYRINRIDFDSLLDVQINPYRRFSMLLLQQEDRVRDALTSRTTEKTEDVLLRMHLIGKFQEIETVFQRLRNTVINPNISLEYVRDEIAHLRALFTEFQMLPGHIVPELIEPFEQMKAHLFAIEDRLNTYANQHPNTQARLEIYTRFRKHLKDLNVPGMAQMLV
jgi:hypothetical protein